MTIYLQAKASSTVDVIDEDKFASIRPCFFNRREFSGLRSERFFGVKSGRNEYQDTEYLGQEFSVPASMQYSPAEKMSH
jgi:hypothetical protein